MLKARGNLSMVKKGHYIARRDTGTDRRDAWVYYKKGDKYRILGNYPKAYYFYRKSLERDSNRPETYFRLALMAKKQQRNDEAFNHLSESWKKLKKFQNVNDVLEIPGYYLKWMNQRIMNSTRKLGLQCLDSSKSIRCQQMRGNLHLLKQMRDYKKLLVWFRHRISPSVVKMMETRGLPKYEYQYQKGILLRNIYDITSERTRGRLRTVRQVLNWLSKEERATLYKPLFMPARREKYAHPKKTWDDAFYDAAIYHFEVAHELKPLDTRAAYQIVRMSWDKYRKNPPRAKKEKYRNFIIHYAKEYLKVPAGRAQMSFVNNVARAANTAVQ